MKVKTLDASNISKSGKAIRKYKLSRIAENLGIEFGANNFKTRFKKEKIYPTGYVPPVNITDALVKAGFNEDDANEVAEKCENVADRSAEDGYVVGSFTPDDAAAICMYTFEFNENSKMRPYELLNGALRAEKNTTKEIVRVRDMLYLLMCALRKLPVVEGITLYRALPRMVDVSMYEEGSSVMWPGISSTTSDISIVKYFLPVFNANVDNDYDKDSYNENVDEIIEETSDKNYGGTLFVIEDAWGYNIQPYSYFPEEEEILLEPGREFEITSVIESENFVLIMLKMRKTKVILEEVFGRVECLNRIK